MKLKTRILLPKRSQQIFIPFDAKVRMQSALHQDTGAAERNCFIDFCANLVQSADVSVRCARPSVEGTEGTNNVADIRVIDVAINDVGNNISWVLSLAYLVSGSANAGDIVRFKERGAVL